MSPDRRNRYRKHWRRLCPGLAATVLAGSAAAAGPAVSGRVTDHSGAPLARVMVTVRDADNGIEVTEYTDAAGRYSIALRRAGAHVVRVGERGWRGPERAVSARLDAVAAADLSVTREPDPLTTRPSAHWLSLLPEGAMKREFLVNCTSCHEVSYPRIVKDGAFRDTRRWSEAIALMRAIDEYGLTPPDFDDAAYAAWLATHLNPDSAARLGPVPQVGEAAAKARYTEFPVPQRPSLPHDLVVGPGGRVWVTGFFNDAVWALDAASGQIETFEVNATPATLAQVRALEFDRAGMLWIVLGGTKAIARLDPARGVYETIGVGMYGHSLGIDSRGRAWTNDYFGNPERLAVVDGETLGVEIRSLPSAGLTAAEGLPLPYGLQIDRDDVLWVTSLAANQLIRFDTQTGAAKSYDMPSANSGPRRLAIAPDGMVWIPEWSTGKLARFDPASETFTEYQPGLSTIGPYDVDINQHTGEVWMSGTLASSVFRFDPVAERWTEYRWPTEPGYVRHLAVDEATGAVWSAYASLPEATPKIVRLEPDG